MYNSGKYTDQKPRDINPDQWPNISCENNYVFSSSRPQERPAGKAAPAQERTSPSGKEPPKGSTSRKKPQGKTRPQTGKDRTEKKRPGEEKTRRERPVEGHTAGNSAKKKTPPSGKKSAKNKKTKKYTFTKREQKRIKKNRRRFAVLIRRGNTRDQARRILSLRQQKARRLSTFFSILALFVFAFSLTVSYCYYEGAPIKEIIIEGDETDYTDKEIIEAAGISVGQSMLTVHEGKVNSLLQSQLPFISGVNISYNFPDTLKMDIMSTKEKYIVQKGKKYMCLDKSGKIVSLKKMKAGNEQFLVIGLDFDNPVVGETFVTVTYELTEEDKKNKTDYEISKLKKEIQNKNNNEVEKYAAMKEIVRLCSKYGLMEGGKMDISDLDSIELIYDSRVRIILGKNENLEMKISAAVEILKEKDVEGEKGRLDMSHDKGIYYFLSGTMDG